MKKKLITMNKQTKKKYMIGLSMGVGVVLFTIILLVILFRHVHSFGEWEKVRDASCSQYGLERRFCDCGEVQEKKSDKLTHTESDWIYDKDKNTLKKVCIICSKNLQFKSLENHTHNWSEYVIKTKPTCTEKGLSIRSCDCGATDELTLSVKGHTFGEWEITLEAKCGFEGTKSHSCSVCKKIETESIPALSHKEDSWVVKDNKKYYSCIFCKSILRSEKLKNSMYLDISDNTVIGIGSCEDTEVVIPTNFNKKTVKIIGEYAFEYQAITGLILSDSITKIETQAFYKCLKLTNIYFGNKLNSIAKKAFFNCESLTSITLPSSLSTLGEYAFAYCTNLESIYINKGITNFPIRVFAGCTSLKEIHYNGTIKQWNAIEKDEEWDMDTGNYTVYCIDGNITK